MEQQGLQLARGIRQLQAQTPDRGALFITCMSKRRVRRKTLSVRQATVLLSLRTGCRLTPLFPSGWHCNEVQGAALAAEPT